MAAGTLRQRKQQVLAWKLKMVMGAIGTTWPRELELPFEVVRKLASINLQLKEAEDMIRNHLAILKESKNETNP